MKNLEELLQDSEYKNLIVNTKVMPMVKGVYLKAGQGILKYGSVLGQKEGNNVAVLLDNTMTPIGVLLEEVDTGEAGETEQEPILTQMYIRGVFNQDALIFAEGTTFEDMEMELRKIDIYIQKMYD